MREVFDYLADGKVVAVLKYQAINMYRRVAIKLRVFLNLALDKGKEQVSHSGRLSSGTNRLSGHGIEGKVTSQLMVMPEPHFQGTQIWGYAFIYCLHSFSCRKLFSTSSSQLNPAFLIIVFKEKFCPVFN